MGGWVGWCPDVVAPDTAGIRGVTEFPYRVFFRLSAFTGRPRRVEPAPPPPRALFFYLVFLGSEPSLDTGFYLVFLPFESLLLRFLTCFIMFYWVLQGFTEFYLVFLKYCIYNIV